VEVPETVQFPRAYAAGLPLQRFDPEHDGSIASLEIAKIIHGVPTRAEQPQPQEPTTIEQAEPTAATEENNQPMYEGN
jgi:hypothetical protein